MNKDVGILSYHKVFETLRGMSTLLSPDEFSYKIDIAKSDEIPDVVIHLSCMASYTPGLPYLAHLILDKLDINNIVLGGPENCCGEIQHYAKEDDLAEKNTRITMYTFNKSKAIRVVSICPDCVQVFQRNDVSRFKFTYSGIVDILVENLDKLIPLFGPVRKKIGIHSHNGTEEGVNDFRGICEILEKIPELEIVPLQYGVDRGIHCQMFDMMSDAARTAMYSELEELDLDALVTPYHSCYRQHIPAEIDYDFKILHYFHIMAESLGINFTEPFKELRLLGSVDAAMEKLRTKIMKLGFHEPTVRLQVAETIFSGK